MVAGLFSAVCIAAVGALAGAVLGSGLGMSIGAGVGLLFGGVFGWAIVSARSYDASPLGVITYLVDHTWSLPNTVVGAIYLTFNLLFGNRIERTYSQHSGCVHLVNGIFPGYLTTIGTVIAGVDPSVHNHEHGHILQARVFGPSYIPLVVLNYVIAAVLPYWLFFHDRVRYPINSFGAYFLDGVYPHTWNEEWCYRVYGPVR